MSIIIPALWLGSAARSSDRFVIVFGMSHVCVCVCVCACLCLGWRKETAGIWTVNKLIFYLVITNGEESARTTTAKDNLERARVCNYKL